MGTRLAGGLFVLTTSSMDCTHEGGYSMAMDVFPEGELNMGEPKRMLLYPLNRVRADRREMVKEKIERRIGSLHEQWPADFTRPPCFPFCGKHAIPTASVKWRPDMKRSVRLYGIAAYILLLLTGCSSGYERDDEPGRAESITVVKMREIVDKEESFVIIFTQTTCSHCMEFKKMLDGYLLDHNVVLYDAVLNEAPASQRKSDLSTVRKTFPGMNEIPSLHYTREGRLRNLLKNDDDGLTEEKFDNWIQHYKLNEKK